MVAAVLAFILGWVYVKFGKSLSNRKQFAANFIMITLTTMVIISIVKSSLALSLGLVGALSIVRFRTAIKEPEELSYMFLSIALGLGLGASQTQVTVLGFAVIVLIIIVRGFIRRKEKNGNFFVTFISEPKDFELKKLTDILEKYCRKAEMRRFDEDNSQIEIVMNVEFENYTDIENLRKEMKTLGQGVRTSILEDKGIV